MAKPTDAMSEADLYRLHADFLDAKAAHHAHPADKAKADAWRRIKTEYHAARVALRQLAGRD